jgi:hypothetical protein
MRLQPELLPNFKTANEETVDENVHTAPSYSFAAYCESAEKEKSKKYFEEEFQLSECRFDIFGPDNQCPNCEGTGWIPVSQTNINEPLRALWTQAEIDSPAQDGFHLVPCPVCCPIQTGTDGQPDLDEHIVKQGSEFELKSKKSGKNLGKYKNKAGAEKRERQVEYFKHVKEAFGMLKDLEDSRPLPWRVHDPQNLMKEDWPLPGHPSDTGFSDFRKPKTGNGKYVEEAMLPSQHNKTLSSAEKEEKKKGDATKAIEDKKSNPQSTEKRKEKEKSAREGEERERKNKKLLPYEFINQKDAEKAGGHLGIHGSHTSGGGVYKPGSSDYSLRDAVAKKKSKQHTHKKIFHEETKKAFEKGDSAIRGDSQNAYALDKSSFHEDRDYMEKESPKVDGNKLAETVRKLKEIAGSFLGSA